MYADSVSLTFEGKRHISTTIGAVTTIIVGLSYFLFVLAMTINFFLGKETFLTISYFFDEAPIDLQELGYDMIIEKLDPRYGHIEALHVVRDDRD